MTDVLTLSQASDGWIVVDSRKEGLYHVAEVSVAGNNLEVNFGEIVIHSTKWSIEGTSHPVLLVEAPSYYDLPSDRDESRSNNIAFYSSE